MASRVRWTVLTVVATLVLLVAAASAIRYLEARDRRPADAARLATELGIGPGTTAAEIGAGRGAVAVEVARIVGPGGRVIATELGEGKLSAIRDAARRARLGNITVVAAAEHETNLPVDCCDVIYMQRVYHHLTDPAGVMRSARRALKPGGRLGIIDFEPGGIGRFWTPRGVPDRGGHGVPKEALVREMRSFGFSMRDAFIAWPHGMYLAVFTGAPTGSNTKPRTIRQVPVFAAHAPAGRAVTRFLSAE